MQRSPPREEGGVTGTDTHVVRWEPETEGPGRGRSREEEKSILVTVGASGEATGVELSKADVTGIKVRSSTRLRDPHS